MNDRKYCGGPEECQCRGGRRGWRRFIAERTPLTQCWFWDVLAMCAIATWWGCETWGLLR